jgi:3-dehydroquinate dehydratase-1
VAAGSPRICVAVTGADAAAIEKAAPQADLFELRIDLIGEAWRELAGRLKKPWLACNRRAAEGGGWQEGEVARIRTLLGAIALGAGIIDIEIAAPHVDKIITEVKGRALCLVSHHDLEGTPPLAQLRGIVEKQIEAGADICKVVTTATKPADNISVLRLIRSFPGQKIVSFAMGEAGQLSRVLSPLVGGYFTYASLGEGKESAAGQLTADELKTLYRMLEDA